MDKKKKEADKWQDIMIMVAIAAVAAGKDRIRQMRKNNTAEQISLDRGAAAILSKI